MNDTIMNLSVFQLSAAYIFVLMVMILFRYRHIHREKQILTAALRMTIQLTIMGYILLYVFENPSWWLTGIMIAGMLSFAIYNALKRVKIPMSTELKRIICFSLIAGSMCAAIFFIIGVLSVRPWYHPQYFIPISGMIVGNSMTGIALGANRMTGDMAEKRTMLENSLMLGATPSRAAREIVNDSFDSAILPTMNNMLTMGIVSLPGMMTGQILSGTYPITAIRYQIGIMLTILGSTALAAMLLVTLGYKSFFTQDGRLK